MGSGASEPTLMVGVDIPNPRLGLATDECSAMGGV